MIRELTKKEFRELYKTVYVKDFPDSELKPYRIILGDWKAGKAMELGYFEDDVLVGYASLVHCGDNSLMLDYYGIVDPYKGQGKGTLFLKELQKELSSYKVMYIEAEAAQDETALRRISFYKRCGAYLSCMNGYLYFVDYHILIMDLGGHIEKDEEKQAITSAYQILYPPKFHAKYLNLYERKTTED